MKITIKHKGSTVIIEDDGGKGYDTVLYRSGHATVIEGLISSVIDDINKSQLNQESNES